MDGKQPKTLHSTRLAVENEFYKIFRGLNQKTRPTAAHATFQRFREKKFHPDIFIPAAVSSLIACGQTDIHTDGQTNRQKFSGETAIPAPPRRGRTRSQEAICSLRRGADLARRSRFARPRPSAAVPAQINSCFARPALAARGKSPPASLALPLAASPQPA